MTRVKTTPRGRSFEKTGPSIVKPLGRKAIVKPVPTPEPLTTVKRHMLRLSEKDFLALVKKISQTIALGLKFYKTALVLLQEAADVHNDDFYNNTMECCHLNQREEPTIKDFKLAARLIAPRSSKSFAI